MSCYKSLIIENAQLRRCIAEAVKDIDTLFEFLEYSPDFVSKEEVITRLGWIDLPPLTD